ncbi:NUDIX hydrolase [Magnetococcus marinus MC-1]|uniref:NUDIX hydrolase n=1 Tax=Magnetococcus marinus (strain ATCC BAA-1437 / JCM 17883 / MC-1) TaxID=156889 RepID=A0LAH2_MAGMM|nr:NUDIX hydrolase [Magnetococcus marinus MC-1]
MGPVTDGKGLCAATLADGHITRLFHRKQLCLATNRSLLSITQRVLQAVATVANSILARLQPDHDRMHVVHDTTPDHSATLRAGTMPLPDRLSSRDIATALQQNHPPMDWSWEDPQRTTAAVLVTLTRHQGAWSTLLIQRPNTLTHHPGQIGLPGGKKEPADSTPLATALRECHEELGLSADILHPLGAMQPYDTRTSGFRVIPLFARLQQPFTLNPCAREVDEVLTVPLRPLWLQQQQGLPTHFQGGYHYLWQGRIIWGVTAVILYRFLERLQEQTSCASSSSCLAQS